MIRRNETQESRRDVNRHGAPWLAGKSGMRLQLRLLSQHTTILPDRCIAKQAQLGTTSPESSLPVFPGWSCGKCNHSARSILTRACNLRQSGWLTCFHLFFFHLRLNSDSNTYRKKKNRIIIRVAAKTAIRTVARTAPSRTHLQ
jgi:hypothetical protein